MSEVEVVKHGWSLASCAFHTWVSPWDCGHPCHGRKFGGVGGRPLSLEMCLCNMIFIFLIFLVQLLHDFLPSPLNIV